MVEGKKALGIDPGTKSFDLTLVKGDVVVAEKSIPTEEIARDPKVLVDAIKEFRGVDLIAGPSGYGSPVICNDDIKDPRTFALEVLLLTTEEQLKRGLEKDHIGIAVYKALAEVVEELWKDKMNVCYIPSVILLPTVPVHRKFNKIDMGTADKLAVTALAVYDHSREHGLEYNEVNVIVVEMGYGYNAVIGVKKGRVIDGIGGTLTSPGFLTAGCLDLEVAVAGGSWERSDVFLGGVSSICNTLSIEEFLKKSVEEESCRQAFDFMIEGVVKAVASMKTSVPEAKEILLSGRLTKYNEIYEEVLRRLEPFGYVRRIRGLKGALMSKEAGQGYAVIAEGLSGGYFSRLIEVMKIKMARGTTLDWVYHPRVEGFKKRVREAYLRSLREPWRFLS